MRLHIDGLRWISHGLNQTDFGLVISRQKSYLRALLHMWRALEVAVIKHKLLEVFLLGFLPPFHEMLHRIWYCTSNRFPKTKYQQHNCTYIYTCISRFLANQTFLGFQVQKISGFDYCWFSSKKLKYFAVPPALLAQILLSFDVNQLWNQK